MYLSIKALHTIPSFLLLLQITGSNALPTALSSEMAHLETGAELRHRDTSTSPYAWDTTYWPLIPQKPNDKSIQDPYNHFRIETDNTGTSTLEQALVVRGIPANAKSCELWWSKPVFHSALFDFDLIGDGLVLITPFKPNQSPPAGGVTYNTVQGLLDDRSRAWVGKFANTQDRMWYLTRGGLTCYPEMWFKLELLTKTGTGKVMMRHDFQENGFFIKYVL